MRFINKLIAVAVTCMTQVQSAVPWLSNWLNWAYTAGKMSQTYLDSEHNLSASEKSLLQSAAIIEDRNTRIASLRASKYAEYVKEAEFWNPERRISHAVTVNADNTITITIETGDDTKAAETIQLTTDEIEQLVYMIECASKGKIVQDPTKPLQTGTQVKSDNMKLEPIVKQVGNKNKTCVIDVQRNFYPTGTYYYFVVGVSENNPVDKEFSDAAQVIKALTDPNEKKEAIQAFLKRNFVFKSPYSRDSYLISHQTNDHLLQRPIICIYTGTYSQFYLFLQPSEMEGLFELIASENRAQTYIITRVSDGYNCRFTFYFNGTSSFYVTPIYVRQTVDDGTTLIGGALTAIFSAVGDYRG